ncbi:hypothetical protein F5B22DRAFT_425137 [Xylaria bambusicola]|uniref:uncharacterized protein n=1 Tax=Xylaria bambusicola TaxID=326684 RepID=UPI0020080F0F|nr:uncharacterized protein F5B22DRAFT_425137 [Xylaria bambusicola]KAI0508289.1 hypothetical protein F5B22DRAFT_425137 [Xylaria bambusicola]
MENNYNLDDLDIVLSDARHEAATIAGPSKDGRRTAPSTRRGSLVPAVTTGGASGGRSRSLNHDLGLFSFGLKELMGEALLKDGESLVSYHEYAVFSPPDGDPDRETRSPSIMSEGEDGLRMFRNAVRNGYGLDNAGNFTAKPKGKRSLQGRVRQVIARRRTGPARLPDGGGGAPDGLNLSIEDYETLDLHPATLTSLMRITSEASFWDAKKENFYVILSFSSNPQPPYDFLSMTYSLRTKTTTALVRRSFDTRWHAEDALDEYERRFDSCRARWAHPLVLPIVLLQVQFLRTEEAVLANNTEVLILEGRVDAVTGTTGQANAEAYKRNGAKSSSRPHTLKPLKRLSSLKEYVEEKYGNGMRDHNGPYVASPAASLYDPDYVPPQSIYLMKEAHEVLKGSIQLLDTLRWMERAVKLLMQVGDELDVRLNDMKTKTSAKEEPNDDDQDDLSFHWHEIRQYLDSIWRLCTSLETDRRMSELRCRAQMDIIFSKLAQEDNNLNARMAVASTRDSSSMKALAVITAIFLPGEYIGTLFGVSMFNWQKGTAGDPAAGKDAADGLPSPTIMPSFWIYWAFTIPLTLVILSAWRGWWVNQDRYFRRHLSNELSNERYWTIDGRPRDLETSFTHDFFSLFSISGARSTTNSTILGNRHKAKLEAEDTHSQGTGPGMPKPGRPLSQTTSVGRDRDWIERFGEGPKFRQVSFASQPRQKQGISVV